jgi:hypothetical protein
VGYLRRQPLVQLIKVFQPFHRARSPPGEQFAIDDMHALAGQKMSEIIPVSFSDQGYPFASPGF